MKQKFDKRYKNPNIKTTENSESELKENKNTQKAINHIQRESISSKALSESALKQENQLNNIIKENTELESNLKKKDTLENSMMFKSFRKENDEEIYKIEENVENKLNNDQSIFSDFKREINESSIEEGNIDNIVITFDKNLVTDQYITTQQKTEDKPIINKKPDPPKKRTNIANKKYLIIIVLILLLSISLFIFIFFNL